MGKSKHAGRKKKKYVNPIELQKQQEAQYKRFFFDKLRHLCKQIGDESLYSTIPPSEKLIIYWFRDAPLKVVAAKGTKIKKQIADVLIKTIKMQQLAMTLDVVKGSEEKMTFADYSLVGKSLEYNVSESDANYPGKEQFSKYAELQEERERIYEDGVRKICASACWLFDDLEKKYLHTYTLNISTPAIDAGYAMPELQSNMKASAYQKEWQALMKQDFRTHQKITIGTWPLDVQKVNIEGETHVAIQTGALIYPDDQPKFIPFTLSLEDLKLNTRRGKQANSPFAKLGLPVYIQQHALERMKKRIGTTIPCFYKSILAQALLQKELIPIAKNQLLIACFTNELKIGYFVAEVVEGIILIRTFLLLTNSGTPEGEKLTKLTGLQIEDRKYLSIDTLQGLVNSDIEQNEAFCNLLHAAGCGSILELCKKINNDPSMMWLLDKSQPKNIISNLITEYLKPRTDEEEYIAEV
ncbi:MAG: hypothetical protein LBD52_05700 [Prevotellaceae bacterium]|jgi:hypothetical protein|nr:hypothetical protein [Prevotellaceae bacterium]